MPPMSTALTVKERAFVEIVASLGVAIKSLGQVPSGELYARVMGHLSLEQYNLFIGALKQQDLVSEKSHLLTWTGPR